MRLGTVLGASWGPLGVILEPSWGPLGAILGPLWAILGDLSRAEDEIGELSKSINNLLKTYVLGATRKLGADTCIYQFLAPSDPPVALKTGCRGNFFTHFAHFSYTNGQNCARSTQL